ncbi:MAG TPA: class I SAM-dependent methyltransferase [Anaerolineales bacterium]|nr:class I SAM-dependent methyltransferase [Anaerolineales bacterium]
MSLIIGFFRLFFDLLYHQFAWTYDLVAAVVSLGRWKDWVRSSLPYMNGRILEIGFGPGHLQKAMNEKGFSVFGLDESRQMAIQARRKLKKCDFPVRLVRGHAQSIPFGSGSFDTVVATFPSEYIFEIRTLREIRRVLAPGGRLVVVPTAWITGKSWLDKAAAWLNRAAGQTPEMVGGLSTAVRAQFGRGGFSIRTEMIPVKGSQVLLIEATPSTFL